MFDCTLELKEIALKRGERLLISGLNLMLKSGDAVELRGVNGSGKSTLLRAITNMHKPLTGKIIFKGHGGRELSESLCFLGHLDAIKANQTIKAQLEFWCDLFGGDRAGIQKIVTRLNIPHLLPLMGASLSAGQKRRISLARILIANRPVWLLDEPFAPLDEKGRAQLGEIIDEHRANGGIIIAAVHDTPNCKPMQLLNLMDYVPEYAGDDL